MIERSPMGGGVRLLLSERVIAESSLRILTAFQYSTVNRMNPGIRWEIGDKPSLLIRMAGGLRFDADLPIIKDAAAVVSQPAANQRLREDFPYVGTHAQHPGIN